MKAHYASDAALRLRGSSLPQSARAHLKYIEREGVALDSTRGVLYGAVERDSTTESAASALRERLSGALDGEQHQFRWIVSPEDGARLNLTAYTRELMRRVEKDLGTELIWGAVNHYNTDNPHVHVVIRGVDARGAEVRFNRAYISHGLRHRAQELATEELGPRTQLEHEAQLAREVTQQRWTSLDRLIARHEVAGVVSEAKLSPIVRERLRALHHMQLAEPLAAKNWRLAAGWQGRLREDGLRGDIIKQMHRELRGDVARYVVLDRAGSLPRHPLEPDALHGRVVSIGLSETGLDTYHAVVETPSGGGYFVPLWPSEAKQLQRGNLVTLREVSSRRERPVDQELESLAGARERRLLDGREPGHAKRLKELARMGLAKKLAAGMYQLTESLRERLHQLDREQPLVRIALGRESESLERMTTRLEETWLDRVCVTQSASELGRQIQERKAARGAALQAAGIPAGYTWVSRQERQVGASDVELSGRVLNVVQSGKRAVAVIQTAAAAGICMPLAPYELEAVQKDVLVTVRQRTVSWARPIDSEIETRAREEGLSNVPAQVEQRLEQLKWLGLARRKGEAWTVSSDLRRQLARRDAEQPKNRLQIRAAFQALEEQVSYLGPTWLDRADRSLSGIESARAARERFLSEQGVTNGPRRSELLREFERVRMLQRWAERHGRDPARALHGYEGVVRDVRYASSGTAYAVLSNDTAVQVVRVDSRSRDLIGKQVVVHGRELVLKELDKKKSERGVER